MRKLVLAIIAVLALFTFIRESIPDRQNAPETRQASLEFDPLN